MKFICSGWFTADIVNEIDTVNGDMYYGTRNKLIISRKRYVGNFKTLVKKY